MIECICYDKKENIYFPRYVNSYHGTGYEFEDPTDHNDCKVVMVDRNRLYFGKKEKR